jgi:hypothetical protein
MIKDRRFWVDAAHPRRVTASLLSDPAGVGVSDPADLGDRNKVPQAVVIPDNNLKVSRSVADLLVSEFGFRAIRVREVFVERFPPDVQLDNRSFERLSILRQRNLHAVTNCQRNVSVH